jgi:hypothetical protein
MDSKKLGLLVIDRLRAAQLDTDLVASFTSAAPSTVGSWLAKGIPPKGEKLNALWHLLRHAGQPSPEFDEVPPFGKYLGELLAFGVISLEDAQVACGVAKPQAVLNVIRGDQRPLHPMDISELKREYGDRLHTATLKLYASLNSAQGDPTPAIQARAPVPDVPPAQPLSGAGELGRLVQIGAHFGEALAYMRYLVSDECTAEDRAFVRQLLGEHGMFELSQLANRLCGERANTARKA